MATGLVIGVTSAPAQLRVTAWNVSNYSSGRVADFQTATYGVFEDRKMAPDLFLGQEFISQGGVNNFLTILNTAAGSPGDWAAAPFVDGPDTDSACFYRTSKLDFLAATIISTGGTAPSPPRNTMRYDVRLKGYTADSAVLACYSVHEKSGDTGSDIARRLVESQRIRDNAETLNPAWHFLLGGDLNVQQASQSPYRELVGSQPNDNGRFFDPINSPGDWNNNPDWRIVHTQDPIGAGGMDDRHDQILVCARLIDGDGFDYLGNATIPYSTTTWNDPNHSYRSWGNDGTSFNTTLTVTGNTMVGAVIAQALINAAAGQGHLPVFCDLRVPPKVTSATSIDFGQVLQNSIAQQGLTVTNDGNVALWTAPGIADLSYSLTASAGFAAPGGSFVEAAGGAGNDHLIMMATDTIGVKSGTVTIASNAPDEPSRVVTLHGEVIASCDAGDSNCDGTRNTGDIVPFVGLLLDPSATLCSACAGDMNGDGVRDGADIQAFVNSLLGGQ